MTLGWVPQSPLPSVPTNGWVSLVVKWEGMVVWGSLVLMAMMSWTLLDPQSLSEVNLGGMTVILLWFIDSRFLKVRLDWENALFPFWMLEERTLERGGPMEIGRWVLLADGWPPPCPGGPMVFCPRFGVLI